MGNLKQSLYERWGHANHPAEWDGREGNGGKCSQRFWEYLWAVSNAGDFRTALDAGGGQTGFFRDLLVGHGVEVEVVDPLVTGETVQDRSVRGHGDHDIVFCISVLEHVEDKDGFCAALDRFPCRIVMTMELGEGCVTMQQLYSCMKMFVRHHVSVMESCPVVADNSFNGRWRPLGLVLEPNR